MVPVARKPSQGAPRPRWVALSQRIPMETKIRLWRSMDFEPHVHQLNIASDSSRHKVLCCGRRFGKALDISTPLPTPTGWTTMGEVEVGDWLIGKNGHPVRVLIKSAVMLDHDCYRVEFSDGSMLVADAGHLWQVRDKRLRKNHSRGLLLDIPHRVITTDQMIREGLKAKCGESNFTIDLPNAIQLPDADLPVDPYILGVWLGDGTSADGSITCYDDEILAEIARRGCVVHKYGCAKNRFRIEGLGPKLRANGLLNNKHIPVQYLRASERQRRDLLAGLLDSDGDVAKKSKRVVFNSTIEALAVDAYELVASLGYRATFDTHVAKLSGRPVSLAYRIGFTPDRPVCYLPRKAERCPTSIGRLSSHRSIVSITKVETRPVQCVMVDAVDSIFLAGHAMIPTHNSKYAASEALIVAAMGGWVWVVGPSYDLAEIIFEDAVSMAENSDYVKVLDGIPRMAKGQQRLRTLTGGRIYAKSSDKPNSLLGRGIDLIIFDEASKEVNPNVWPQYLTPTLSDRSGGSIVVSTPTGNDWFKEHWDRGNPESEFKDPNIRSWRYESRQNPYLPPGEWEYQQSVLPERMFDQEYRAIFLDDAGGVFRGFRELMTEDPINIDSAKAPSAGRYVVGVDLAKYSDWTVIVVFDAIDRKMVYMDRFNKIDWTIQKPRILKVGDTFKAPILIDSSGVGDPIVEELMQGWYPWGIEGFKFSNITKSQIMNQLAISIEQKEMRLLKEPYIGEELSSYQYRRSDKSGLLQMSAPPGKHDDVVVALALAWEMVRRNSGTGAPEIVLDTRFAGDDVVEYDGAEYY